MVTCLRIHDIVVSMCIGVGDLERSTPQDIKINCLITNPNNPDIQDDYSKVDVCYHQLINHIQSFFKNREYRLIESASQDLLYSIQQYINNSQLKIELEIEKLVLPIEDFCGSVKYSISI